MIRHYLTKYVEGDDRGVNEMDTPGGKQETIIINGSDLYSLILFSKLPSAKQFKRWMHCRSVAVK